MSNLETATGKVHKGKVWPDDYGQIRALCNPFIVFMNLADSSRIIMTEEPVTCKTCLRRMAKEKSGE